MTPLALGATAVALAGPVPAALARWKRLHLTPIASLVLWQAIALAAVLAAVGAGLSLMTASAWEHGTGTVGVVVAVLAGLLTVVVVARLLFSGHRVGTSLRTERRLHREHLDLLAEHRGSLGRVRVLDHDVPVAYCVPDVAQPRVVLSGAALAALDEQQVTVVLAHERAHLAARHDLVLEAFTVLHRAFPRWVSSDAALREVRLLVEILADRAALKVGSAGDLGRALLAMAGARPPVGAMGASAVDLVERVRVLSLVRPRPLQTLALLAVAWALLVAPTALVVAPWLNGL
ncbi:M56 family metallopeptidase [Nocardioides sp. Y6]|uniref:M56 family metallopeptidase n=1 Tax=Nocardioides malaquae TaxID=2773426 RepID=A0ABR9RVP6_9ACTN|nr:M56 family metallopeptidase [Nocardioides malaquae]MBE7325648.1 M56 family metallopeptidase [Nocardioides malaquae]